MGRKQDQAVGAKMMKTDTGKPKEQGRVRKLSHSKSKGIENVKRVPLKSKAGFTLYSQPSDATKSTKPKIQKSLASTQKQPQDRKDVEDQFLHQMEIVSQMQIQTELKRAAETSGIIIPAVDFANQRDNSMFEDSDHPELSTPFNKRLVSSTPDPERLLDVEVLEQHGNQPSLMCPQMIPERDTSHSIKAQSVLTAVASSLNEKLKLQRQKCMENQKFLQQQHQQQDPFTSLHHFDKSIVKNNLQQYTPNKESPVVDSSSVKVTKAEWVFDVSERQCLKTDETTLGDSINSSKENHGLWQTSTSIQNKFGATSSETYANSDAVGDNLIAKTKGLTKVTMSQPLMVDQKSQSDSSHTSENVHLGYNPTSSYSGGKENNLNKSSVINHQSEKYRAVSFSENCLTGQKYDELTKETLVLADLANAFPKPETPTGTSHFTYFKAGKAFTESGISITENDALSKPKNSMWKARRESPRKQILQTPTGQMKSRSLLALEVKKIQAEFKQHGKDLSKDIADLPAKTNFTDTRLMEKQGAPMLTSNNNSQDKGLDTTSDSCDLEVTQVFTDHENNINIDSKEFFYPS